MRRQLLLIGFALITACFWEPAVSAEDKQIPDASSVKVFYATNRRPEKETYGRERSYEHEDHGISYGTVDVAKPMTAKAKSSSPLKMKSDGFYRELRAALERSKKKEIIVFVHGYNNGFEDAIRSGAHFAAQGQQPVVVFDWCSQHKLSGYTIDECNAEWSARHFQLAMQRLEKEFQAQSIMTVSHSMGNRLVYWYLQSRYDKQAQDVQPFKEVTMTSPDVDRATFKNYFYKVAKNASQLRIYVSAHDKPLLLSKWVHYYDRLGDGRAPEDEDARWEYPGFIAGTQTLNFTSIDKKKGGFLGHHIPYPLIVSMHETGEPGAGLQLEDDKSFKDEYKGEYKTVKYARK